MGLPKSDLKGILQEYYVILYGSQNKGDIMNTILIKPHHFMDIIKLYGSGIETFVPDEKMGHDFYRIANEIIQNPECSLKLTIEGDDICQPCKMFDQKCVDGLNNIIGFKSKDQYNKVLDCRIISRLNLTEENYSAKELCRILYDSHEIVYDVWKEENDELTERRRELFQKGAAKFLKD